jgi:aminoglycoside 6'-N-acetyltransferase I
MERVRVREVRDGDEAEWLRLRSLLWPDLPAAQQRDEMRTIRENPLLNGAFVYERADGSLGGFVEVSLRRHPERCDAEHVGYLESWYVDTDARRAGVGRRLVEAAEGWARRRGVSEMDSDCEIDNDQSLSAHLALGFVERGRTISLRKRIPIA